MIDWKNKYNEHIIEADSYDEYPYAGYTKILQYIYEELLSEKKVLFVGIGTGDLAKELYKKDIEITGIDFSEKMLALCKENMPKAKLIHYEYEDGMPDLDEKFDAIVSIYYLKNMSFGEKIDIIQKMKDHLEPKGKIIIGDVAFENIKDMESCSQEFEELWDEDEEEGAFIISDFKNILDGKLSFEKISFCSAVLKIKK